MVTAPNPLPPRACHPFRGGPELALLVVGRLLARRDPKIDCCSHSPDSRGIIQCLSSSRLL
jgi:hypothetical protein